MFVANKDNDYFSDSFSSVSSSDDSISEYEYGNLAKKYTCMSEETKHNNVRIVSFPSNKRIQDNKSIIDYEELKNIRYSFNPKTQEKVLVGYSKNCDIVIPCDQTNNDNNTKLDKFHCLFFYDKENKTWSIIDNNSSSGVWIKLVKNSNQSNEDDYTLPVDKLEKSINLKILELQNELCFNI